jgi:hypothetical protein
MKANTRMTSRTNVRRAKRIWGPMTPTALDALRQLTGLLTVSVAAGDLQLMHNVWYITHAGLLRIAQRRHCFGIETLLNEHLSDPGSGRWVFKAVVFKNSSCKGFTGYGDADPSNVSSIVHGAEMRVAETRAVNRALRKAYGIGLCSVEELGSFSAPQKPSALSSHSNHAGSNKSSNGQPRLRDQLCVLVRQHNLDPTLVKAYAADFCGTPTLSGASRVLIESFINHLSSAAKGNRDSLVCKLNSYAPSAEAKI